jgi:alpha-galactosidase
VVEVFLQPDASSLRRYKEFEVSPNGYWIDLDIAPGEKHDLKSGMRRRVVLDGKAKTWTAELAIPMKCLVQKFDPSATWRVIFYRVEGASEPRFYSAWCPTGTPVPNFHVPEAFGELVFTALPAPRK